MALRFLKIAVVYLFIGALLGFAMGMSQQFTLAPVHAHLLLLGWASFALVGLVYHLYPAAAETKLARIHFWLHNLGLPAFMLALGTLLTGHESAGPQCENLRIRVQPVAKAVLYGPPTKAH